MVTRRGVETAVVVPIDEWERLTLRPKRTLKELLLAEEPRFDLDIPERGSYRHRPPFSFED